MEAFLQLPMVQRIGFWNSRTRDTGDAVANWRDTWEQQLRAYEGDPTDKDLTEIEFETIQRILEDFSQSVPGLKSLHDMRKALFKFNNDDVGTSEEDQMLALFLRVYDEGVWIPNKFTRGDNNIFHCLFNNCPFEENTMTTPEVEIFRKIHLAKDQTTNNNYYGVKSNQEELYEWAYTLPTFDDLSALTVRAIMRFKNNNQITAGPNVGGDLTTNGAWLLYKDSDNKIKFLVYDGTSLKTIESDSTHNNEIVEVYAIIDGTTSKMYIDGVLQADTAALAAEPAYYSEDSVFIGDVVFAGVNNFRGTMFELAIDAEVITP